MPFSDRSNWRGGPFKLRRIHIHRGDSFHIFRERVELIEEEILSQETPQPEMLKVTEQNFKK
jgi:hypothetical protein